MLFRSDGYLSGVLLQPRTVAAARWLPPVSDLDGRPAPAGVALDELQDLVRQRHAELDAAIGQRQWFDPWIYQLDEEASAGRPSSSVCRRARSVSVSGVGTRGWRQSMGGRSIVVQPGHPASRCPKLSG